MSLLYSKVRLSGQTSERTLHYRQKVMKRFGLSVGVENRDYHYLSQDETIPDGWKSNPLKTDL